MKKYIMLLILVSSPSFADPIPEVQEFVRTEIARLADVSAPVGQKDGKGFELAVFKLRIQAEIGFDVDFATLTVVPGIEFGFEKVAAAPAL